MIVDTHIHYMEAPSAERPYSEDGKDVEVISVESMIAESSAIGVDRIVQISASAMGYDNRYGLEGATRYPGSVLGVMGRFDPLAPDIERRLKAFMAESRMLGTRLQIRGGDQWNAILAERKLDPFFEVAERERVPVGITAPNRAKELRRIAERFPGLRVISDHMTLGRAMTEPEWSAMFPDLLALAARPNVWLKTSLFPESAPAEERYPFPTSLRRFRALYEQIGAQRLLWGSNYPPVSHRCTYREALDFARVAADFLPSGDREAILGQNYLSSFAPHELP